MIDRLAYLTHRRERILAAFAGAVPAMTSGEPTNCRMIRNSVVGDLNDFPMESVLLYLPNGLKGEMMG